MRYRRLSTSGDMVFGHSANDFLTNTPQAVAQAVMTSLKLWLGEWYLNTNDGTQWLEGILGRHSKDTADATLVARISSVQGVVSVENFSSQVNTTTRKYSVSGLLNTVYGPTQLQIDNVGNL